jgi:hypothetical protein
MINIEGSDLENKLNQIDLVEKEDDNEITDNQICFKSKDTSDSSGPVLIKSIDSKNFSKILFKDKYIRDDERGKIEFVSLTIINIKEY